MRKETLKDFVKSYSVETIAGQLTSLGMEFLAKGMKEDIDSDDVKKFKRERNIYVRELKNRIKII
jgi:hypothetical protein